LEVLESLKLEILAVLPVNIKKMHDLPNSKWCRNLNGRMMMMMIKTVGQKEGV
jgi:hypothetical protein